MAFKVHEQVTELEIAASTYARQIEEYGQRVLPDEIAALERLGTAMARLGFIRAADECNEYLALIRECMD